MSDEPNATGSAISADVEISASAAKVWEVLADFNGMYTWAPSIEDTEQVSDAASGVGAIRRNTAAGFGAIDQEVTKWEEGAGFAYKGGAFGPFSGTVTTYQIRETGLDASACTAQISYRLQDPAMAGSPGEAQLRAKLEAGLHDILGALKTRVETGDLVRVYKSG